MLDVYAHICTCTCTLYIIICKIYMHMYMHMYMASPLECYKPLLKTILSEGKIDVERLNLYQEVVVIQGELFPAVDSWQRGNARCDEGRC